MADDLTAKNIEPFSDIAAGIEHMAWTHGINADPDPIYGFATDVNRLCDQDVAFDRFAMLLLKLEREGLVGGHQGVELHAAYLRQKATRQRLGKTGQSTDRPVPSPSLLASMSALDRAAANALAQRQASSEIMTYGLDGWMVREYPGGRIERLCPIDEFRSGDYPQPGFTPPPSNR